MGAHACSLTRPYISSVIPAIVTFHLPEVTSQFLRSYLFSVSRHISSTLNSLSQLESPWQPWPWHAGQIPDTGMFGGRSHLSGRFCTLNSLASLHPIQDISECTDGTISAPLPFSGQHLREAGTTLVSSVAVPQWLRSTCAASVSIQNECSSVLQAS